MLESYRFLTSRPTQKGGFNSPPGVEHRGKNGTPAEPMKFFRSEKKQRDRDDRRTTDGRLESGLHLKSNDANRSAAAIEAMTASIFDEPKAKPTPVSTVPTDRQSPW